MKRFLTVSGFLFLSCGAVFAMTGREIMEKSREAVKEPSTARTQVMMSVHSGTRVEEKEFELVSKTVKDSGTKALVTFTKPTTIKLLTHTYKNRDDDQWLKLSSGKIKRIAGTDKGKPFVNSHIYYEDLESREIDDYNFTAKAETKVQGQACYSVEGVKKTASPVYSKVVLHVRKSDFFVLKIDFFIKDEHIKSMEIFEIKEIDGIKTPIKSEMSLTNGKGKTVLEVKTIKYNEAISDSVFSNRAL